MTDDRRALVFPEGTLTYAQLRRRAGGVARALPEGRVAVWATPTLHTAVAVIAALAAGRPVVPLNPGSGRAELAHVLEDARPTVVLTQDDVPADLPTLDALATDEAEPPEPPPADAPAFVVYTSGTTGPPKGVVLTRAAIDANLDALAEIWGWTEDDVVAHSLPLFHVHGLIVGVLGPLRRNGTVRHLGRFDPQTTAQALSQDATMLFGVPTMYHRLAKAATEDEKIAQALSKARLLVSGSAALDAALHARLTALTGQHVVERYGMTETLMITSARPGESVKPGYVGTPLPHVEIALRDDDGAATPHDDETVGNVLTRGPSLLAGYLGHDEPATDPDGWFRTGDLGCLSPDGTLRLVGRSSTDLIKSGGYRIGAGEIEQALLGHPAVQEAAVLGEPDDDLGERIVAWVVAGDEATDDALVDHVASELSTHKRPREIRRVAELPRNAMGKVVKAELRR